MTTQVIPLKLNAGQVSELQSGDKLDNWVTPSGGSPGGSNTQVQFNNSGAFGGSSNFAYNNSTHALSLTDGTTTATLTSGTTALHLTYGSSTTIDMCAGGDGIAVSQTSLGFSAAICTGSPHGAAYFNDSSNACYICDGTNAITTGNKISCGSLRVTSAPTSGYVLTTDGSGNGTWQAAAGMAIGNPVTSGTSTYVLYVDGGNNLAQDANLTWDYTNQIFHIAGAGTSNPALEVTSPTFAANFATENGGGFGSAGFFSVSSFDCFLAVNNNSDPECAAIFNDAANRIILCDGTYAARLTDGTRLANFIQSGANPIAYFYDGSNHNAAFCSPSYSGSFGSLTQSAVFCVSGSYAGQFSDGTHTATFCDGTNTIAYTASTPSDWAGSSPATDVWVALNRIAAALTGLSAPP